MCDITRDRQSRDSNSEISFENICGIVTRVRKWLVKESQKADEVRWLVSLRDEVATSAAGRLQSGLREFRIEIDSHLVRATTCKLHPCIAAEKEKEKERKRQDGRKETRISARSEQSTARSRSTLKRKDAKRETERYNACNASDASQLGEYVSEMAG